MTDEEVIIHRDFLEHFSSYNSFGVEVIYSNNSLTFNYNVKSKKYVDKLLMEFYDMEDMIIIFRCRGNNISFTSSKLDYKNLFLKVKSLMDEVKFLDVDNQVTNPELKSIFDLFVKGVDKNIILTIGITNRDNDKLFKLVSTNYSVQECFKQVGLVVKENTAYFKKSKFNSIESVFESIRNNPLVYYYQPSDVVDSGFVASINIIFYLIIDILAMVVGIYLLMQ